MSKMPCIRELQHADCKSARAGLKQRKKRKLYQNSVQPIKKNDKKNILEDYILPIIIVLFALAFLISSFFRTRSGYDWFPGR
jgi:uncharacterized membrane protein YvbJ